MLRKMKIGGKLTLAFGVLLVIFAGVGAMSWMNMSGVQEEAESLAQEYVPEMVIATDVQKTIQNMMYEIRGYGYTYQKDFLDAGRKAADEASAAVKQAADLAAKYPDLKVLKEGATKSEVALKEYMDLVGRTEASVNGIDAARKRADDGARSFLENAHAFLRSQNEVMHKEIKEGAEQAKLEERLEKITLINDVIDAGNGVRVDNFAGQATRELALIEEGVKRFTHIADLMKDIRATTRQQSNIDQLDAIQKAADQYKSAMEEIVSNWRELDTLAAQRVTAGQSIQTLAGEVSQAAAKHSLEIADNAVGSLASTILVILIATVVAVLLGAAVAFLMTRSLTVPLKRVAELAGMARDGDFTIEREDFRIVNRDELGAMADALAEMVESQRGMIRELKQKSVHLSAISEETAASTEEVTSTTNEVAESNAKLAEQTRHGRANAIDSSKVMLEMSSLIQIAQSLAANADKNSTSMAEAADQGYETVTKTVEHMENIKGSVQETEELLKQLDTYSQRIGVVGDTITGLADQTNLLALNAAIEAARAGEAGRGFAATRPERVALRTDIRGSKTGYRWLCKWRQVALSLCDNQLILSKM